MPSYLHFIVTGRVQGVGFRAYTIRHAQKLGVVGWCRNTRDGKSVEGVAQGETDTLTAFKAILRKGPGQVERVKEDEKEIAELEHSDFHVKYN